MTCIIRIVIIYVFSMLSRNVHCKNKQDLTTNLVDISVVWIGSKTLREDVDNRFTQIFNDIVLVASKVNIDKKTDSCSNFNRTTVQTSIPEDYYLQLTIFIPSFDSIILWLHCKDLNQWSKHITSIENRNPSGNSIAFIILSRYCRTSKTCKNDLADNGRISLKVELLMWWNTNGIRYV